MEQQAGTHLNQYGRQPFDPSIELMQLIGRLQRTMIKEEIIELPEALYKEAVDFIIHHPSTKTIINYPGRPDVYMLCRHWIGPETLGEPDPKAA